MSSKTAFQNWDECLFRNSMPTSFHLRNEDLPLPPGRPSPEGRDSIQGRSWWLTRSLLTGASASGSETAAADSPCGVRFRHHSTLRGPLQKGDKHTGSRKDRLYPSARSNGAVRLRRVSVAPAFSPGEGESNDASWCEEFSSFALKTLRELSKRRISIYPGLVLSVQLSLERDDSRPADNRECPLPKSYLPDGGLLTPCPLLGSCCCSSCVSAVSPCQKHSESCTDSKLPVRAERSSAISRSWSCPVRELSSPSTSGTPWQTSSLPSLSFRSASRAAGSGRVRSRSFPLRRPSSSLVVGQVQATSHSPVSLTETGVWSGQRVSSEVTSVVALEAAAVRNLATERGALRNWTEGGPGAKRGLRLEPRKEELDKAYRTDSQKSASSQYRAVKRADRLNSAAAFGKARGSRGLLKDGRPVPVYNIVVVACEPGGPGPGLCTPDTLVYTVHTPVPLAKRVQLLVLHGGLNPFFRKPAADRQTTSRARQIPGIRAAPLVDPKSLSTSKACAEQTQAPGREVSRDGSGQSFFLHDGLDERGKFKMAQTLSEDNGATHVPSDTASGEFDSDGVDHRLPCGRPLDGAKKSNASDDTRDKEKTFMAWRRSEGAFNSMTTAQRGDTVFGAFSRLALAVQQQIQNLRYFPWPSPSKTGGTWTGGDSSENFACWRSAYWRDSKSWKPKNPHLQRFFSSGPFRLTQLHRGRLLGYTMGERKRSFLCVKASGNQETAISLSSERSSDKLERKHEVVISSLPGADTAFLSPKIFASRTWSLSPGEEWLAQQNQAKNNLVTQELFSRASPYLDRDRFLFPGKVFCTAGVCFLVAAVEACSQTPQSSPKKHTADNIEEGGGDSNIVRNPSDPVHYRSDKEQDACADQRDCQAGGPPGGAPERRADSAARSSHAKSKLRDKGEVGEAAEKESKPGGCSRADTTACETILSEEEGILITLSRFPSFVRQSDLGALAAGARESSSRDLDSTGSRQGTAKRSEAGDQTGRTSPDRDTHEDGAGEKSYTSESSRQEQGSVPASFAFLTENTDIYLDVDPFGEYRRVHIVPFRDTLPSFDRGSLQLWKEYLLPFLSSVPGRLRLFREGDVFKAHNLSFKICFTDPPSPPGGAARIGPHTAIFCGENESIGVTMIDLIGLELPEERERLRQAPARDQSRVFCEIFPRLSLEAQQRLVPPLPSFDEAGFSAAALHYIQKQFVRAPSEQRTWLARQRSGCLRSTARQCVSPPENKSRDTPRHDVSGEEKKGNSLQRSRVFFVPKEKGAGEEPVPGATADAWGTPHGDVRAPEERGGTTDEPVADLENWLFPLRFPSATVSRWGQTSGSFHGCEKRREKGRQEEQTHPSRHHCRSPLTSRAPPTSSFLSECSSSRRSRSDDCPRGATQDLVRPAADCSGRPNRTSGLTTPRQSAHVSKADLTKRQGASSPHFRAPGIRTQEASRGLTRSDGAPASKVHESQEIPDWRRSRDADRRIHLVSRMQQWQPANPQQSYTAGTQSNAVRVVRQRASTEGCGLQRYFWEAKTPSVTSQVQTRSTLAGVQVLGMVSGRKRVDSLEKPVAAQPAGRYVGSEALPSLRPQPPKSARPYSVGGHNEVAGGSFDRSARAGYDCEPDQDMSKQSHGRSDCEEPPIRSSSWDAPSNGGAKRSTARQVFALEKTVSVEGSRLRSLIGSLSGSRGGAGSAGGGTGNNRPFSDFLATHRKTPKSDGNYLIERSAKGTLMKGHSQRKPRGTAGASVSEAAGKLAYGCSLQERESREDCRREHQKSFSRMASQEESGEMRPLQDTHAVGDTKGCFLFQEDEPKREHEEAQDRGIDDEKGRLQCMVCMESIEEGQQCLWLPCGHTFHWERCMRSGCLRLGRVCPLCRQDIATLLQLPDEAEMLRQFQRDGNREVIRDAGDLSRKDEPTSELVGDAAGYTAVKQARERWYLRSERASSQRDLETTCENSSSASGSQPSSESDGEREEDARSNVQAGLRFPGDSSEELTSGGRSLGEGASEEPRSTVELWQQKKGSGGVFSPRLRAFL
ncbi:zinc c3hc4 type (ring finger) domain-containing protein [Cystoisospora suis]|uniref:Zinc c3hc4 type (Ring finger) domain-containing protein n=1 Tax=Cystoisospora suis TaxID=483139 RepID=A0A2C6LBJ4_9APIC|nr:zinc c3hc4 type (ring finger) domain-containing protein [Cystoisospora suis]